MDRCINRQHAIERFFRPLPPQVESVFVAVHENDSYVEIVKKGAA
jgi:hypothetical protein